VIEVLQNRQRQGISLRKTYDRDKALYEAAKHYCGSWQKALHAAGLPPQLREWNPTRVIRELQTRHRQGLSLRWAEVERPFYNAACRYFGNWRKALAVAGLPAPPERKWTPKRVIQAIQMRKRQHLPLEYTRREDRSLVGAAARYYGTWSNALRAAGMPVKPMRQWSKQMIIKEIRARLAEDAQKSDNVTSIGPPKYLCLSRARKDDCSLYAAARTWFGSWPNAIQAAGLVPRIRHCWTADRVIEAVRDRHRAGLPMVRVLEDDPWLCAAARLYFGGWHNTMEAAGLTVTSRKRWPRKRIIAAIDAHQRQGSLRYVWRDDKRLFWAASLRFGNWQNALKAAGFTPKRYQWWSRERIVQELHHKNRQSQYNISIIDRPLAAAAVRLFGGLRLAWEAAGIEPKDRRWTKRRIIEAIQDRYVQGLSLTGKGFGNPSVVVAARREFGSWPNALAAAAIPVRRKCQ
jgi:hypothetical protein